MGSTRMRPTCQWDIMRIRLSHTRFSCINNCLLHGVVFPTLYILLFYALSKGQVLPLCIFPSLRIQLLSDIIHWFYPMLHYKNETKRYWEIFHKISPHLNILNALYFQIVKNFAALSYGYRHTTKSCKICVLIITFFLLIFH